MTADRAMLPTPRPATAFERIRGPKTDRTRAPANGMAGMSQRSCSMSASHPADRIRVEGFVLVIQFQHERQSHRYLRGRHGQDEQKHHLPVRLSPPRSRDDEG